MGFVPGFLELLARLSNLERIGVGVGPEMKNGISAEEPGVCVCVCGLDVGALVEIDLGEVLSAVEVA